MKLRFNDMSIDSLDAYIEFSFPSTFTQKLKFILYALRGRGHLSVSSIAITLGPSEKFTRKVAESIVIKTKGKK